MKMILYQDYKEFLELLNKNNVEYLVVGAYALGFHGHPRYTGDLDIWVKVSEENTKNIVKTLSDFGVQSLGYKEKDFLDENTVIQIGVSPLRIDLLMSISGVVFEEAFKNKEVINLDGIDVFYLHKNDFKSNKRASGRLKDLADLEAIE